jgi:N-acetyl-anhydromuramyl-L-alanine amidase AmpD
MPGAHSPGWNDRSIGIVFAGNYNLTPPPVEMLQVAIYRLIKPLMVYHDITIDRIQAHRDQQRPGYTDCPGRMFPIERLRNLI